MERNNIIADGNEHKAPRSMSDKEQKLWSASLQWWYNLTAPPTPIASASFSLREKVRHGRLGSLTIPIFMLFLCSLLPQAIANHNLTEIMMPCIGLGISILALFLNRKGLVAVAAILILFLEYVGGTLSMLHYPGGLTTSNLYDLDFSIIPDVLALAFFSANILFLITSINAIQVWAIVTYGPHDSTIAFLLQNAPAQIFSHIYTLQLITASVLYLWALSTEHAIVRADRAEEIASFERREKERQEQELVQKRQLDAGIQQILQVHVAVANGDLNARAPLNQGHMLWQVASSLNNLIARFQNLSSAQDNHRPQAWKENEPITDLHKKNEPDRTTHPKIARPKRTEFTINQRLKNE